MLLVQLQQITSEFTNKKALVYQSDDGKIDVLSYNVLNQRSTLIAGAIVAQLAKLAPDERQFVGVMGHNKLESVIAQLAILKAGAAFVPLDVNASKARFDHILNDAKLKCIIACGVDESDLVRLENDHESLVFLHDTKYETYEDVGEEFDVDSPSEYAYLLYTSGSTGKPKGVLQKRDNLVGLMLDYVHDLSITAKDNILQLATHGHDQAIVDIYAALLTGATLCLYDHEALDVAKLQKFMLDFNVSIYSSIPRVFDTVFSSADVASSFKDLRIVTIGGEEILGRHVRTFNQRLPAHTTLITGYGATECSWISYLPITHENAEQYYNGLLPLGYLAPGTEALIVSEDSNEPVELGCQGELCINSSYMTPGYWQLPEVNQTVFFEREGTRYYRTGDLSAIKMQQDQPLLAFYGRRAHHEKISGQRINLHGIEAIYRTLNLQLKSMRDLQIEECVLVAAGQGAHKKLVMFIQWNKIIDEDDYISINDTLKTLVAERLQAYEMPALYVHLDNLPYLANCKVDRKALKKIAENDVCSVSFKDTVTELHKAAKYVSASERSDEIAKIFWHYLVQVPFSETLELTKSFHDYGVTSLFIFEVINHINGFFRDTFKIDLNIEAIALFQNNKLDAFKKLLREKQGLDLSLRPIEYSYIGEDRARVGTVVFDRECNNAQSQLVAPIYYTGREVDVPMRLRSLQFNFEAMQKLCSYYSNKHHIDMSACSTKEDFIDRVSHLVKLQKQGQYGLTCPTIMKNGHHVACVLVIGEKGVKPKLFFNDSAYGRQVMGFFKYHVSFSALASEVDLYVNLTSRQENDGDCLSDLIYFLKTALRTDFAAQVQEADLYTFKDEQAEREYQCQGFHCRLPDLYKGSQSQKLPEFVDINTPMQTDRKKRTLSTFWRDHQKTYAAFMRKNLFSEDKKQTEIHQSVAGLFFDKAQKWRDIIQSEEPKLTKRI